MIDRDMTPTAGARELAKQYTVAQLRELMQDEFGVKPPSKAVKIEVAQQLDDLRHNAKQAEPEPAEIGTAVHEAAERYDASDEGLIEGSQSTEDGQAQARAWYDRQVGEPQVFQGAMHTYLTDDQLQDRVTDVTVKAVTATKQVTEAISNTARQAARALVPVAYAGYVAVVRSMGRTVRGKVVDADLRAPDRDGANRVLLVVEHPNGAPGRKATRTLHALVDVKLEPVAS